MSTRISHAALTALTAVILFAAGFVVIRPAAAQESRVTGFVWTDANCDGIRQDSEALRPHARLTLRWAGSNGVIDATDREIQQSASLTGEYLFTYPYAGEPYFISFRSEDKPVATMPAPYRQGGDPTRDNDLTTPLAGTSLWATEVFTIPADGSPTTGIDIGLCAANAVYLPLAVR